MSWGGPQPLYLVFLSHLIPVLSPCAESVLHSNGVDENLDSKKVVEGREKRERNINGVRVARLSQRLYGGGET